MSFRKYDKRFNDVVRAYMRMKDDVLRAEILNIVAKPGTPEYIVCRYRRIMNGEKDYE